MTLNNRCLASRSTAHLVLEVTKRLLSRVRVQTARTKARTDPVQREPQALAALDLVPEELEAVQDANDPSLRRIDAHAQSLQDRRRRGQGGSRFSRRRAGDDPVVRVPRQPVPPASHFLVERRQQDIAQQG